jgi:hypothetical protein
MFKSAVFHDQGVHADAVYELGRRHKYVCKQGRWSCERFLRYGDNNKRIGALLKTIDFFMRREYGFGSALQPGKTNKALTARVEKEILKFLEDKRAATPPAIDIDLSKLRDIRAASLVTRDRLLVEEPEIDIPLPAAAEPAAPPDATGLDADEHHFLACLLHGRPYADFLRGRGLMPSLLVDGINEKLFDRFGDTVIADAGDAPAVLPEYGEALKAMFAQQ